MNSTQTVEAIRRANRTGRVVIRFAGEREHGDDYGGTEFRGRSWEVETDEGRSIVPESVARIVAEHFAG